MHIQMMLLGKGTRIRRDAVTARVAAQPEAIAQAFYVGKVNLAPGVILGF